MFVWSKTVKKNSLKKTKPTMYCIKMQATKTQKSNKIFCIVFQHCTHLTQDMRTSQAQYSAANKNAIPVQWTHLRYYIALGWCGYLVL